MTNVIKLQKSSTSIEPLPRTWIEKLFDKMLLDYGKKFTDQWMGADPEKLIAHWAAELAGFSGEELRRGYEALASRDWPPTLPEFKRMCKPSIDPTVAYYEALNGLQEREKGEVGTWSHPAIFWASAGLRFDLLSQSHGQMKARWEKALQDQMAKGQWEPIPAVMVQLPAPGNTKTDRDEATRMLAQYNAGEVVKTGATDHRRWIKKILERQQAQDEYLPSISVRLAKEAMTTKTA